MRAAVVILSLHSNRIPKTEIHASDWGTAATGQITLLFGLRKVIGSFK